MYHLISVSRFEILLNTIDLNSMVALISQTSIGFGWLLSFRNISARSNENGVLFKQVATVSIGNIIRLWPITDKTNFVLFIETILFLFRHLLSLLHSVAFSLCVAPLPVSGGNGCHFKMKTGTILTVENYALR